ncbi:MAG: NUDIX hydrolase [SAR202 cluster bacterium]|nr:NUDIX hydrolase [SAR202 cluster bacterium]
MTSPRNEPTIESRRVFEGRIVNLRVDTVRMANERTTTREVVEHAPCVCIVPLDDDGSVILVRQYRKPVEKFLLEVPAGGMDKGEDPKAAAHRELQEETGLRARRMEPLSFFWTTPGFCDEGMNAFLATGLTKGDDHMDEDEDIEVERVPLSQVPDMISSGQIQDVKTIASLMLVFARRSTVNKTIRGSQSRKR